MISVIDVKNESNNEPHALKTWKVSIFKIVDKRIKGLRALRPFFGPHLRSKYESGNKSISLHDFIRPIFLVFHFSFSLDLAVR